MGGWECIFRRLAVYVNVHIYVAINMEDARPGIAWQMKSSTERWGNATSNEQHRPTFSHLLLSAKKTLLTRVSRFLFASDWLFTLFWIWFCNWFKPVENSGHVFQGKLELKEFPKKDRNSGSFNAEVRETQLWREAKRYKLPSWHQPSISCK